MRFLEWREGDVGCVHVTLAIWENARETLTAIGTWNRMFADHADLVAPARSAEDIEAIRASGRTAVVLGFQNASPLEDDIELNRRNKSDDLIRAVADRGGVIGPGMYPNNIRDNPRDNPHEYLHGSPYDNICNTGSSGGKP